MVRGSGYYDYNVLPNLSAAVEQHDVAVAGRVTGWSEGRSVNTGDMVTRYATVTVQVDLAARIADPSQRDVAYVAVSLGSDPVGPDGAAVGSVPTLGELERAVPTGTRIIAIGNAVPEDEEEQYGSPFEVADYEAGRPAGAPLASFTVQGSLVETTNGCTVSLRAQDEDVSYWTIHAAELAGNEATATTSPGSFQNLVDELESSATG
ncbi:hypothetical protein QE405_003066 [Nocardioides zeae]|uniref:Uncharacterized protein n=1 Tax=Nocardioides zeae TaxID=1457234 RepID=A0AAJ1U7V8_9ACTN|nr:hypothetical protein [Nocardioides zeae]